MILQIRFSREKAYVKFKNLKLDLIYFIHMMFHDIASVAYRKYKHTSLSPFIIYVHLSIYISLKKQVKSVT